MGLYFDVDRTTGLNLLYYFMLLRDFFLVVRFR